MKNSIRVVNKNMLAKRCARITALLTLLLSVVVMGNVDVKLGDISRLTRIKDNALVGYGVVSGLAGTGDSSRSLATMQSMKNIVQRFGINVPVEEMHSRNVAAVMVTATLPPFAQIGNKLDINVTSLGDARSLVGGTLLLTSLVGPDQKIYALAQGPVSVGGYSYDLHGNVKQKNHPTTAYISGGAIVERSVNISLLEGDGTVEYSLLDPSFDTANQVVEALRSVVGEDNAWAVDPARIRVYVGEPTKNLVSLISRLDKVKVRPELPARVVVNERTGTVVAGGDVIIAPVTIAHGDLNVAIKTEFFVSQPGAIVVNSGNIATQVIPDTDITVEEERGVSLSLPGQSTVAQLVKALNKVNASSRDIITILQAIRRAGALQAELVVQ